MDPTFTDTDEHTPLLTRHTSTEQFNIVRQRLYISHFLSACNSRVFEFGAVLYLTSIFPGTLRPISLYAFARSISAILFSHAIGLHIDTRDRLSVVRLSIGLQRISVAISCAIFLILAYDIPLSSPVVYSLLTLLAFLACVEKLASIMNLVAVEKDWVVVVSQGNQDSLRDLNSQMRRIDLFCKLSGPFAIACLDAISTRFAIIVNLVLNILSFFIEYYAIKKVYNIVPDLQKPKYPIQQDTSDEPSSLSPLSSFPSTGLRLISLTIQRYFQGLCFYFNHSAFLPSFTCALLYCNVLSFSGQMIAYLSSAQYNSFHIGIARTVSVFFEMSATWIAPVLMSRIGSIRSGLRFICWQTACLTAGVSVFIYYSDFADPIPSSFNPTILAATALTGGTIISRIGLWGFDLSTQIIVQEKVEAHMRGSFSSWEASFQNFFELCSYASTIVFYKPNQFQYPVLLSLGAVVSSCLLYSFFVRTQRGHLFHFFDKFR